MIYKKLKRTWSHNSANYIPNFEKIFPELKNLSKEELCNRFIELNLEFFQEEEKKVPFLVRLTFPIAIITIILMFFGLPILFIITGEWSYKLSQKPILYNWFRCLKLL